MRYTFSLVRTDRKADAEAVTALAEKHGPAVFLTDNDDIGYELQSIEYQMLGINVDMLTLVGWFLTDDGRHFTARIVLVDRNARAL